MLSAPEFRLSDRAVAAGLDGEFFTTLTIDESGKVKDVILHGGAAWLCSASSPPSEAKEVEEAVKKHLRSITFTPAMKDGKPRKVDVTLDFAIGEAYKRAVERDKAKQAIASGKQQVVKGGVVNGRAATLPKPQFTGVTGFVVIQVLIDENGLVEKAGVRTGYPRSLFPSARSAACNAKFSPTIIEGKPVRVTGMITYRYVK